MEQAIYIGGGLDVTPILMFTNIHTFIYIDSIPISRFVTKIKINEDKVENVDFTDFKRNLNK